MQKQSGWRKEKKPATTPCTFREMERRKEEKQKLYKAAAGEDLDI